MMLATLRGDSFGQGAHALAAGENALVLFMLALHATVLTLILLVGWFAWHRRHRARLPAETEALLDEMASPPPPEAPSETGADARPAWERSPDWWKQPS